MAGRWSQTPLGEKIIIWMIGIEIFLSLGTIWLTVHEARLQGDSLEAILTAQKQVDADLTTVNSKLGDLNTGITRTVSKLSDLNSGITQTLNAVKESAETSKKINGALQSQLRILTQQQSALQQQTGLLTQQLAVQKQEWEKENQRPALLVMTVIEAPLSPTGFIFSRAYPSRTFVDRAHVRRTHSRRSPAFSKS